MEEYNLMDEKSFRWNRFADEICDREMDELSELQQKAVLCFWYDTEMNSGGHSGYFDCYPDTDYQALYDALLLIGSKEIADNFKKALTDEEEEDGWMETDDAFYEFSPSLYECLSEFVENHKDEIFI